MNSSGIPFRLSAAAILLTLTSVTSIAQDLRESLFRQTDTLVEQAKAADAPLLSPSFYDKAAKDYANAEQMLSKNKSIEAIRNELNDANVSLGKAIENSELAKVTFVNEITIRNAAVKAQADVFASDEWTKAESDFAAAARGLEGGDVNRAKSRAVKAGAQYSKAELVAIQAAILGAARSLIDAANDDKIGKQAPVTLAKAEALVAQAEKDLVANRYATGSPLDMAVKAEYEAKHATYLASQARRLKDNKVTSENLLLEWESPLAKIAKAMDTSTDFSNGFAVPADASLTRIASAKQSMKESNDNVANLNARVADLEEQLGITTKRAEAGELRRQQLASLQRLFRSDEARILQEGNQIIIRLIGLQFDTGQAVIESKYFALLRKLDQVPQIYPNATLIVEGHTDSQGNDVNNLALSERRANSVRDYLLAATMLNASGVNPVGYGKSRPIANNETADGRAKNRRTDVIVVPAR